MIHAAAPYLYWNQELILIALDAVALQVRMHQVYFKHYPLYEYGLETYTKCLARHFAL